MKKLQAIILLLLFWIYSSLFSVKNKRLEQGIMEFSVFIFTIFVLATLLIIGLIVLMI